MAQIIKQNPKLSRSLTSRLTFLSPPSSLSIELQILERESQTGKREKMLLGRVRRPSIESLEALEMERPSPKVIKDDPLSVYETTLMKLKEGSQRCQSLHLADVMSTDVSCMTASNCLETTGAGCSLSTSINSTGEQAASTSFPSEERSKTPSILYLFSKYKNSKNGPSSPEEESMPLETVCSSLSTSPSVSNSEQMSSQIQRLSEECFESRMI